MAVNNDLFAGAMVVEITAGTGSYTSPAVSNAGYGMETGEYNPNGYRSAWWMYTPTASGTATVDTELTTGAYKDTILAAWAGPLSSVPTTGPLAMDDQGGAVPDTSKLTLSVTANTTYYFQVTTYGGGYDSNYVLRVVGPRTTTPPVIDLPPFGATVTMRAGLPLPVDIDVPPVQTEVQVDAAGGRIIRVASPGLAFQASLPPPGLSRIRRTLLDPINDAVVPVLRPVFTVELTQVEGPLGTVILDVQYDYASTTFTGSPTLISRNVPLLAGRNIVRVVAAGDLPPSAVKPAQLAWRARLRIGGVAMDWTPTETFTVDPLAGDHAARATWSVTGAGTDPHLWYVTPAAGIPGDLVTAVGQGFSSSRGTVKLAGLDMPVQRWTHMAATPDAYGAQRVIDSTANRIDAEHDEVVVLVPDTAPPGGPVYVADGDGATAPDEPPRRTMFVPLRPIGLETSVSLEPPPLPPPPPPAPSNDNFASATPIILSNSTNTTVKFAVSNVGATVGSDEPTLTPPPSTPVPGYRSLWWSLPFKTLTKQGAWVLSADATGSTAPVSLGLYIDRRALGLGVLENGRAPDGVNFTNAKFGNIGFSRDSSNDGWVLLFRVASIGDVDATYNLTIIATPSV